MKTLFIYNFLPSGQDYTHVTKAESETVVITKMMGMASPLAESDLCMGCSEGRRTLLSPPSLCVPTNRAPIAMPLAKSGDGSR